MKKKIKASLVLIALALVAIYYYLAIPAVNIHSKDVWMFVLVIVVILGVLYVLRKKLKPQELRANKGFKTIGLVFAVLLGVYLLGSLLSSPIINAKKYQKLMKVDEKASFTKDIDEISFDKIPLLDRDSATILGDRKMGSMVDMVSQFEADDIYSQINYKGTPTRVSPLKYASLIKWFTNQKNGIPAYLSINMTTQETSLVKLDKGIKYSTSDHFNRNIYRYLRFKHPTYIYGELSFEVDDNGVPYWIAPVKKFNIGLFGGETVGKAVLCNAVTGKCTTYAIDDVPKWVDRVYSADLLVQLFDYHGTLKHGFINSVMGQKDCLETTDGYNYLAMDDDVWMYTGVTSVNGDQSNVGFVLCNQRTMETKYYEVEGATESAAMGSAEGQVQNLKYKATFPLLLNIDNEPTYFIALKDDAGLVKKYAMVNVQKYQIVAIGDSVSQCEDEYQKLLVSNGIQKKPKDEREIESATGTVTTVAQAVIDGTTHYYLVLDNGAAIYDAAIADYLDIIRVKEGQNITIEYKKGEKTNTVMSVKINQ